MNDQENKNVDEVVDELRKKIAEIEEEGRDRQTQEKIKELKEAAMNTLNNCHAQLKKMAENLQDNEQMIKTAAMLKQKGEELITFTKNKAEEVRQDPKLNQVIQDAKEGFDEFSSKLAMKTQEGIEQLKSNEELMQTVDKVKQATDASVKAVKKSIDDFVGRPDVHENIEKAKEATIDVTQKTADAVRHWLRPDKEESSDELTAEVNCEKSNDL